MLVSAVYPEYPWLPWKFEDSPFTYWGPFLKSINKQFKKFC